MNKEIPNINLLDYNKSISENAKILGMSKSTLKRRLMSLGLYKNFIYCKGEVTSLVTSNILKAEYNKSPNKCACCNGSLPYEQRKYKYCSHKCSATITNSVRITKGYTITEENVNKLRASAKQNWKNGKYNHFTVKRIESECPVCKKIFLKLESNTKRKFCSRKCSHVGKDKSNCGGYREGSGRGKSGWYKGYYCSSSWELAWVIYSLEHNLTFSRNLEGFKYVFKDKTHKFFPDFKLEDNSYVEIKGQQTDQWKAKLSQFSHKIKVLSKEEMKPILSYVTSKYGTDYIKLYDGNPHNNKTTPCCICGEPSKKMCCSRVCSGKLVASKIHNKPLIPTL